MTSELSRFGPLLARHRKALCLTQKELALKVGCDTSYVSYLERGDRPCPEHTAVDIAAALEIPYAERQLLIAAARADREAHKADRVRELIAAAEDGAATIDVGGRAGPARDHLQDVQSGLSTGTHLVVNPPVAKEALEGIATELARERFAPTFGAVTDTANYRAAESGGLEGAEAEPTMLLVIERFGVPLSTVPLILDDYAIGRARRSDIVLDSPYVSELHARLIIVNNRCFVEDIGSKNSVLLNGNRLASGERHPFRSVDTVRIAEFQLRLMERARESRTRTL